MFCPKCKRIMIPKKEENKRFMICSCGYKENSVEKAKIRDIIQQKAGIDVVDKNTEDLLPLTDATCPKCGHEKAFYWLIQTRASDEPETKFHRCQKCKHTWREYS